MSKNPNQDPPKKGEIEFPRYYPIIPATCEYTEQELGEMWVKWVMYAEELGYNRWFASKWASLQMIFYLQ